MSVGTRVGKDAPQETLPAVSPVSGSEAQKGHEPLRLTVWGHHGLQMWEWESWEGPGLGKGC